MAQKVHICKRNTQDGFDISELVDNISYTTSIYNTAGKLTFTVKKDPNNILEMSVGNSVSFYNNDIPVFYGYVFSISVDRNENYSVVSYDQTRYLQNEIIYSIGKNTSLKTVFYNVCERSGMKDASIRGVLATNPKYVNEALYPVTPNIFNLESYFSILRYAIDDVNMQVGGETKFIVRDEFGTLVLTDIDDLFNHSCDSSTFSPITKQYDKDKSSIKYSKALIESHPIILGDESLVTDFTYDINIDEETYNEVYMFTEQNGGSGMSQHFEDSAEDVALKNKWGLLRKCISVDSSMNKAKIKEYGKKFLEVYNTPTKKLKITALGYDGLYAGNGFILELSKLNIHNMKFFITSAEHRYSSDMHTMILEVAVPKNFTELLKSGH